MVPTAHVFSVQATPGDVRDDYRARHRRRGGDGALTAASLLAEPAVHADGVDYEAGERHVRVARGGVGRTGERCGDEREAGRREGDAELHAGVLRGLVEV